MRSLARLGSTKKIIAFKMMNKGLGTSDKKVAVLYFETSLGKGQKGSIFIWKMIHTALAVITNTVETISLYFNT